MKNFKKITLGKTFNIKGDSYGKYEIIRNPIEKTQDKWDREFWVNKKTSVLTKEKTEQPEHSDLIIEDKDIIAITNDRGHYIAEAYIVILNPEKHNTCDNVRLIIKSINYSNIKI